jgi:hypothetical protein
VFVLFGCSKDPSELGSPIGVRLEGQGTRDLEMAVALTKGEGEPAPSQVGEALAAARRACPELSTLGRSGELVRVAMEVKRGRLRAPPAPPSEALAACVVHSVEGARMGRAEADGVIALVEVREAQPTR